jgi:hypothetical protein
MTTTFTLLETHHPERGAATAEYTTSLIECTDGIHAAA